MDEEFVPPAFYVVRPDLESSDLDFVLHALKITPITAVIVSDVHNTDLALKLGEDVRQVRSEEAALQLARDLHAEHNQPSLVIGKSEFLTSHYPDGTTQEFIHVN